MQPIQISDQVKVECEKYSGFGTVAEIYPDRQSLFLQTGPFEVLKDIPIDSVLEVDSTSRLIRESFERPFKVVDYVNSKPNPMLDSIKQVWPGILVDVFPDSILDKGPEGSMLYIGPTGENVIVAHCSPDKQRVFVIPFVGGALIKNPDGVEEGKELTLLAISPFKISAELIDENEQVVGIRDKNWELFAVQERLEALLSASRVELNPTISTLSEHHKVVQKALEWGLTWVYDGDFKKGILDTIPNEPGTYLCGNGQAGLLYKLPGNRFCIMFDSRKCELLRVES